MLWWLVVYGVRRLVWRGSPAIRTLDIDGLRFTLNWTAAEHVPVREVIVRREYELTADWAPGPGDLVLDVGANAGVFAVRTARATGSAGRVIAIEPNDDAAARMAINAAQNGYAGRVEIVRVAVADHDTDDGRLAVGRNTTTAFLDQRSDGREPSLRRQAVRVRRLDTVARELGVTRVDLLKIDVEGSEDDVLRGASETLRATRRAVLEVSDPVDFPSVRAQLEDAGFTRIESKVSGPDSGAWLVFADRN